MNQQEMILKHLTENGEITPLEAMNKYGIMRLGARIFDLKENGYEIKTIKATSKNRYGKNTTYAKYVLEVGNGDI